MCIPGPWGFPWASLVSVEQAKHVFVFVCVDVVVGGVFFVIVAVVLKNPNI